MREEDQLELMRMSKGLWRVDRFDCFMLNEESSRIRLTRLLAPSVP